MGRTIYDVVPNCLSEEFVKVLGSRHPAPFKSKDAIENQGLYLVHFETGKKIYQLYSELDFGDDENEKSLAHHLKNKFNNPDYFGPWAFPTLGGAGGQTVFGALTTGTHGGDIHFPPIADAVQAMHLVADGGKHYWIERSFKPSLLFSQLPQMTSDEALRSLYGSAKHGGEPDTIISLLDKKPRLLERKPIIERITGKILNFVDVFINGMGEF